jgi:predicted nucleic acid-binding protein
MTSPVFFDTNVLIDVIARREPFYEDSAAVWTLAERGAITGLVSVLSFTNTFYIVRRLADLETARKALHLLSGTFTQVGCDASIIQRAINTGLSDFEDAVQFESALSAEADCLLTRNIRHFPTSTDCPVLTPAEFLAANSFE